MASGMVGRVLERFQVFSSHPTRFDLLLRESAFSYC